MPPSRPTLPAAALAIYARAAPMARTPNSKSQKQSKDTAPREAGGSTKEEHRDHSSLGDTTSMEMASSSAPSTSYPNISLAQAVLTLSINAIIVWLSAVIKSYSSSTSSRRPTVATTATSPSSPQPQARTAGVDMDVVLGVMGAAGASSVGFEEAAALFEEEEATVEEAQAAFGVFDRDGDGFIDARELGSVLRSLGFAAGVAAAKCQRMIDAYDEDKDGRIDFHEFLKLMERSH